MESRRNADRAVPALLIAGAAVVFIVLVVAGGAFYQSFDEAKYVGLGRNLVAGRGYTTVFGSLFLTHPPAWPLILAAPEAWFGIDPLTVGRFLNVLSGAGLIVLSGLLAWRIRPAAGGLAAVAMLGVTYLSDLSRTARLDVPGAAIAVLAVLVGTWSMRRDSVRGALVAGAIFAVAFLVKETSVVFLAVPTLAAIFDGRSAARQARLTAAIALTFAIGTSWWFVVVAEQTGRVFRTSLPAWVLVPLGIGLGAAIVGGLAAPAILARWSRRVTTASGVGGRTGPIGRLSPAVVGAAATIVWVVVLLVLLARSPELGGAGLIDPAQIRAWLVSWQRTIAFPVLFAASGLVLAVALTLRARGRARGAALAPPPPDPLRAAAELIPAVVASGPFLIFVVATGEPPRNDFAPLAFAIALAAGGWLLALEELVTRRPTRSAAILMIGLGAVAGVLAGLALAEVFAVRGAVVKGAGVGAAAGAIVVGLRAGFERRRPGVAAAPAVSIPVLLVIAFVGSAVLLAIQVHRRPGSAETAAARTAVATIAAWVRSAVPTNETLAAGSLLGNETAIELPEYRVVKLSAREATVSAAAPLGLSIAPGDAIQDWLSVDPHPRKTSMFLAIDAGSLVQALRSNSIAYWIYVTGETTAAPTIVPALTPAHGFDVAAHWTFPGGGRTLEAWVFRVAPDRLEFGGAPIRIAPAALTRLVGLLAAIPDGPAIATRLTTRILVDPPDSAGSQAMLELRALAAR
jgi:hypothetical protein